MTGGNHFLPWVEWHPTLACKLILSSVTPLVQAGWSFSSWVLVLLLSGQIHHMAVLPAYELIPLHTVLLLSHDQSLAQDQVTSPVGRPLEKPGVLAAPEVQLLLLALCQRMVEVSNNFSCLDCTCLEGFGLGFFLPEQPILGLSKRNWQQGCGGLRWIRGLLPLGPTVFLVVLQQTVHGDTDPATLEMRLRETY